MTHLFRDIPLAVIGMACRLPGANTLTEFWQLLIEGGCAIGEAPAARVNRHLHFDPQSNVPYKTYTITGGTLDYAPFDAARRPTPARILPHAEIGHLTICQVAAEACRHAGLNPFDLPIRNAGVYIGHNLGGPVAGQMIYGGLAEAMAEYLREVAPFARAAGADVDALIGQVVRDIRGSLPRRRLGGAPEGAIRLAAMIVAESLGLNGPAMILDAACSSALQGLVMAARGLQLGRIEMAVVGGASYFHVDSLMVFSKAQSASRRYRSCPFDADADGLVSGEGYVAVIVKTLERALADGDPIQAVVRGIGVSSDGRGKSLWAPRKEGQVLAMRRAYQPGLDISRLQYIEAHATSTRIGDMTELKAMVEALGEKAPNAAKIPIGGVKANIGHTLESAGLAGLVKTILAMRHGLIPRQINVQNLNPGIDWKNAPFYVPRENTPWPEFADGHPRRAAVNSFGIGGLNVHVVLDQHAETPASGRLPRRTAAARSAAPAQEPIAIIGQGCVFPGARTVEAFWELLSTGADAKSDAPLDRWNAAWGYEPNSRKVWRSAGKRGGFVADFKFDWRKHKLPPNQVDKSDPLQLMILDATDAALAQAGYDKATCDNTRVGVVVGTIFGSDFSEQLLMGFRLTDFCESMARTLRARGLAAGDIHEISERFAEVLLSRLTALQDETGGFTPSTLASRLTKMFDLMGGAVTLDAGQASSLAALYSASDMLLDGSCDMVICAAGHRAMGLSTFEFMSLAGFLAQDASRAPFDAQARGHLPGEGVGVVVLKRLADALRDGNTIRGVIRGIGASFSSDVRESVELAIERAQQAAGGAVEESLIETSGFGLAEDDAELDAIAHSLAAGPRAEPLVVSSLVGQLGHTQGASGMASLLAATHALDREEAPARYGMHAPPARLTKDARLRVANAPVPLKKGPHGAPRVAGVNSLDAYGAVYHLVLERGTKRPSEGDACDAASPWRTVRLEAASLAELREMAANADPAALHAAAAAGGRFASATSCRLAIVSDGPQDLATKLKLAARSAATSPVPFLTRQDIFCGQPGTNGAKPKIAFLFSGQGSQHAGMLRSLVEQCPAAQQAMRRIDETLTRLAMPTFAQMAWESPERLGKDVGLTQLSLLCADMIAFHALQSSGLRPDYLVGHSFGEYPALCAAGAWDFENAALGARARADAIEASASASGGMVSVAAAGPVVEQICRELGGEIYPANYNSPEQTVVGGADEALERLSARLQADKTPFKRLAVPRPFHTPLMAGVQHLLAAGLAPLAITAPRLAVWSTVTNAPVQSAADIHANLVAQMSSPVRYVEIISQLANNGARVFVEVGPRQILTGLHHKILVDRNCVALACDDKTRGGLSRLLAVAACLEVLGIAAGSGKEAPGRRSERLEPRANGMNGAHSHPHAAGAERESEKVPSLGTRRTLASTAKPASTGKPANTGKPMPTAKPPANSRPPIATPAQPTIAVEPAAKTLAASAAPAPAGSSTVSGAPYETGAAFGRANAAALRRLARRFADVCEMPVGSEHVSAAAEFERATHAATALLAANEIEELRGVADAAQVSAGVLAIYHAWSDARLRASGGQKTVPDGAGQRGAAPQSADLAPRSDWPWGDVGLPRGILSGSTPAGGVAGSQANAIAGQPKDAPLASSAGAAAAIPTMPLSEYLAGVNSIGGKPPFDAGDRVCHRFVLRSLCVPTPVAPTEPKLAGNALIVGRNPVGLALRRAIEALGRRAVIVPLADDIERTLESVDKIWAAYQPLHFFVVTPFDADAEPSLEAAAWRRRSLRGVLLPYLVCQRWFSLLSEQKLVDKASVVAATACGGDFGLSGSGACLEGGALTGLFKGLSLEVGLATKWKFASLVIDGPRRQDSQQVAESMLRELWTRPPFLEIGYRDGQRRTTGVIHRPAMPRANTAPTRGKPWLITGGARGITAAVAKELGSRFGVKLHLVGASPRAPLDADALDDSPRTRERLRAEISRRALREKKLPAEAWNRFRKGVEIEKTLRGFEQAGISAVYHACDVSDRQALSRLIDEIRRTDGPLEGVVHGAGIEVASRFLKKDPETVARTISSKVDGAAHLMALTRADALRFFIGFGSISGRWGSIGQTDYCLASDMLAKLIDWFRVQRPECHATCFHWQPWAEVGMAARDETRGGTALQNLQLLPVAEGIRHFIDELLAGCPEPEVVVTDWDYYKRFHPDISPQVASEVFGPGEPSTDGPSTDGSSTNASLASGPTASEPSTNGPIANGRRLANSSPPVKVVAAENAATASASLGALLDRLIEHRPGERVVAEARFHPLEDPFLREHRLRDNPTLPLVVALEAFVEAATLATSAPRPGIICRDVEIADGLRFFGADPITARVTAAVEDGGVSCSLTSDFRTRAGKLVQADRLHFSARVTLGDTATMRPAVPPRRPESFFELEYPPRGALLYHGPPLRLLKRIAVTEKDAVGLIEFPHQDDLLGPRAGRPWRTPSAGLDACLYACGLHAWAHAQGAVTVPAGLAEARFQRDPLPGERATVHVLGRKLESQRGEFDFVLFGEAGDIIFKVRGYQCHLLRGPGQ